MNQAIEQLRAAVEAAEGMRMKSPKDFEILHQHIFEKIHQSISTSTLKRVWGYMSGYSSVRPHTLDLLARYIDYRDFDDFCEQQGNPSTFSTPSKKRKSHGLLHRKDWGRCHVFANPPCAMGWVFCCCS